MLFIFLSLTCNLFLSTSSNASLIPRRSVTLADTSEALLNLTPTSTPFSITSFIISEVYPEFAQIEISLLATSNSTLSTSSIPHFSSTNLLLCSGCICSVPCTSTQQDCGPSPSARLVLRIPRLLRLQSGWNLTGPQTADVLLLTRPGPSPHSKADTLIPLTTSVLRQWRPTAYVFWSTHRVERPRPVQACAYTAALHAGLWVGGATPSDCATGGRTIQALERPHPPHSPPMSLPGLALLPYTDPTHTLGVRVGGGPPQHATPGWLRYVCAPATPGRPGPAPPTPPPPQVLPPPPTPHSPTVPTPIALPNPMPLYVLLLPQPITLTLFTPTTHTTTGPASLLSLLTAGADGLTLLFRLAVGGPDANPDCLTPIANDIPLHITQPLASVRVAFRYTHAMAPTPQYAVVCWTVMPTHRTNTTDLTLWWRVLPGSALPVAFVPPPPHPAPPRVGLALAAASAGLGLALICFVIGVFIFLMLSTRLSCSCWNVRKKSTGAVYTQDQGSLSTSSVEQKEDEKPYSNSYV